MPNPAADVLEGCTRLCTNSSSLALRHIVGVSLHASKRVLFLLRTRYHDETDFQAYEDNPFIRFSIRI